MTEPRHQTWPVNVLVEQRAELRWVPNEHKSGEHLELEAAGEYRIDLDDPFYHIWDDRPWVADTEEQGRFQVAARIEDGEIVLWLERRPVKPLPVGRPVEAEQPQHACPGGCRHLVARSVISGGRMCPVCGFQEGERA